MKKYFLIPLGLLVLIFFIEDILSGDMERRLYPQVQECILEQERSLEKSPGISLDPAECYPMTRKTPGNLIF